MKGTKKSLSEADEVKLPVKAKGKAKRKLRKAGKAKVKAEVTSTLDVGDPNTQTEPVTPAKRG